MISDNLGVEPWHHQIVLDQAHGRIENLMGLAEYVGKTVCFVTQETAVIAGSANRKAKYIFSRHVRKTPWFVDGFVSSSVTTTGLIPFTPRFEISTDLQVYCLSGREAIDLELYNCHGQAMPKHINNAVFATEEDADRYIMWISMYFDEPVSPWRIYSQDAQHSMLGIMTIKSGMVNMKNTR